MSRLCPQSCTGMNKIRMAAENTRTLTMDSPFSGMGPGQRGSMVLYRLAIKDEQGSHCQLCLTIAPLLCLFQAILFFPYHLTQNVSAASPTASMGWFHMRMILTSKIRNPPMRMCYMTLMTSAGRKQVHCFHERFLECWRTAYCVFLFSTRIDIYDNARNLACNGNIRINSTGQAPVL